MPTLENDVTLLCVDCVEIQRAIKVLEVCKQQVKFKNVKLLTNIDTSYKHKVQIEQIHNLHHYSEFIIKRLVNYVDTDYVLVVQYDGFILNPHAFDKEFFNYDYLGCYAEWSGNDQNSIKANGGFSLRSKKFLEVCSTTITCDFHPEDLVLTSYKSDILISNGIKFAPLSVNKKFGIERRVWNGQFGFHSYDTNLDNWMPGNYLYKNRIRYGT